VLCEKNAEYVNVRKLLDSIERPEVRRQRDRRRSEERYPLPHTNALSPRKSKYSVRTLMLILIGLIIIFGAILWVGGNSGIGEFLKNQISRLTSLISQFSEI